MDYLHHELTLNAGDAVEVKLDSRAYVRLLDDANFARYKRGEKYQFHGGDFSPSVVSLNAPQAGRWHLVVDLGGSTGTVRPFVRVLHPA